MAPPANAKMTKILDTSDRHHHTRFPVTLTLFQNRS